MEPLTIGPSELGRPILLFMIIYFILSYFEWFISRLREQRHKNKVKLHVNNKQKQLNTSQIIDGHSQSARMNDNIGTLISLAK